MEESRRRFILFIYKNKIIIIVNIIIYYYYIVFASVNTTNAVPMSGSKNSGIRCDKHQISYDSGSDVKACVYRGTLRANSCQISFFILLLLLICLRFHFSSNFQLINFCCLFSPNIIMILNLFEYIIILLLLFYTSYYHLN